jgi:type IV pilus assembly protein PilB
MIYKGRIKLGELLIKEGLISEEQLQQAIKLHMEQGLRIGQALIKLGFVQEKDMVICLSRQLGIPYASLGKGLLKPTEEQNLERLIPEDFARRYEVLPLSRNLNLLTVAVDDPLDLMLIDNLKKLTSCEINLIVATRSDLLKAIDEFYGKISMLQKAVGETYAQPQEELPLQAEITGEESLSLDKLIAQAEEAPVVKLVDLLIRQAIKDRASDIHIEPFKEKISIRYRIDGQLYEIPPPSRHLLMAIVSRVKILARLDIAEKRLPQDGAFTVKIDERVVDLRISIIPTIYGEKTVMRILDKSQVPLDLAQLGFEAHDLEAYRRAIKSPWGLVFLTGPTGSGKSTTLYATLNEIKSPRKNILTVEDPVEYRLDGINQVQVKPDIGLTFAAGLRAFLRQDPNIIMVGEVRDLETARICIQAALTGHLVLSTLHTNDAPTAIGRLIDIGVEPFLLTPSVLLVAAQRLCRRLCTDCKEPYEPTPEILKNVKIKADLIYRAKGCEHCNQTGYRGRTSIYEVMLVTEHIRELIGKGATYQELKQAAREEGMHTLRENGLKKVEDGISSLEDVLSVTMDAEAMR